MAASTLSINSLIQGSIIVGPSAAQPQNTRTGLLLGSSNVIDVVQRYRIYSTPAQVLSDFGSTAPEALAAEIYFEQSPQASQLIIGRWVKTASSGQLVGAALTAAQAAITAWQAINNGGVDFTIDGTPHNLTALDFTGVFNLNGVAAIIQTAIGAAGTFVYNATFNQFILTSATTGTSSVVSFATAGTGTDISSLLGMTVASSGAYIAQGALAETALAAVTLFDSIIGRKFGPCIIPEAADSDHEAVGNYFESAVNKHSYWVTSSEGGILVASSTSDIAYILKAQGLSHSVVQYSSQSLYAAISAMVKAANIDYSGTNTSSILMYKQEPGVTPENLNSTQLSALLGKNANVFVEYDNDTAIIQNGTMANGQFIDTILGCDNFLIDCQTALYNVLYTSPTKVPQTDQGMSTFVNALTAVCQKYVTCGFLAPGVWTNPGIGALSQGQYLQTGYYVFAPAIATQSVADRAARKSVTFQVAAKLAGGVQTVLFSIVVNL